MSAKDKHEGEEESVAQTRFATTILTLLRASLGEDIAPAIAEAVDDPVGALRGVDQGDLSRQRLNRRSGQVGLKLRESAQFWAESYPAMEYRHGPISIVTTGRAVWAFGALPTGLAEQVAQTGTYFEHCDIDHLGEPRPRRPAPPDPKHRAGLTLRGRPIAGRAVRPATPSGSPRSSSASRPGRGRQGLGVQCASANVGPSSNHSRPCGCRHRGASVGT